MDTAFTNVLTWLTTPIEGIWHAMHKPLKFEDALVKASNLCSKNPAKILGIYQPESKQDKLLLKNFTGSIEIGKREDLIIADIEKLENSYKLNLENVFVKGYQIT